MRSISKYVLPSAVSLVAAIGVAAPAAQAANFKVSGQVDRAVVGADNGKQTDYGFVDNVGSNSRFRFVGDETMPNGVKVGFNYEMAFAVNPSTDFNVNSAGGSNNSGAHNNFTNVRLGEVYLEGNFGKLSFGKGNGAANGTSEVDLSGTQYLGGGSAHYYASGISFIYDNHVVHNASGNAVNIGNGAYNNFDALSRRNRVRYDTPSFGGATLSASLDNGHAYEIAGRYNRTFAGGVKLAAAVDWVDSENANDQIDPLGHHIKGSKKGRFQEYGGSASLLLPSGLNFTGMYKKHNAVGNSSAPDSKSFFTGVGYIMGRNHFQVGWGGTRDWANNGSRGNSYQAAYVFDWTKSVQLYGSYHLITLDHVYDDAAGRKVSAKNINYLYLGTRFKFL